MVAAHPSWDGRVNGVTKDDVIRKDGWSEPVQHTVEPVAPGKRRSEKDRWPVSI